MNADFCRHCKQDVPTSNINHPLFCVCPECTLLSLHAYPLKRLKITKIRRLLGNLPFQCRSCNCDSFSSYRLGDTLMHGCADCMVSFASPADFTTAARDIVIPTLPIGASWPSEEERKMAFSCNLCQGAHYWKLPVRMSWEERLRKIKRCGGCSALFLSATRYSCVSVALS